MDNTSARSLKLHEELHGKIEVVSRAEANTADDLALLYTPGVAEPCRQIQDDYQKSWELTRRSNLVAVVTGFPCAWTRMTWTSSSARST